MREFMPFELLEAFSYITCAGKQQFHLKKYVKKWFYKCPCVDNLQQYYNK